ncbi:hypothetical protein EB118_10130 [bacterium]|nr:hypothetical protein [bacterium]
MADKAKKISELTALTAPAGEDLLVIVDDPTGTSNATKKVTVSHLLGNSSANVAIRNVTPANSTITVKAGTMFYDNSYIYIATSNNNLKRVSLSSF